MKFKVSAPTSEWVSVLKGAAVAAAGVALTYVLQNMSASDFGPYGPLVAGVLSVLANILRKSVTIDAGDTEDQTSV